MMETLHALPPWLPAAYVFVFGLLVGSFLNVCIHRMPRNESVVSPRSHCPSCNAPIAAKDNIPALSYLLLSGRCRHCGMKISPVYPAVELVTGVLLAAVYLRFGPAWKTLIYSIVVCALVVITMIDLEHQIIPDRITLPGIVFGFAAGTYTMDFWNSLIGFLAGGGSLWAVAILSELLLKKEGMGGGDIKFLAAAGALLGWKQVFLIIFLGSFLGAGAGLSAAVISKIMNKDFDSRIPFGPFLAAATLVAMFYGGEIIDLYWRHMTGKI